MTADLRAYDFVTPIDLHGNEAKNFGDAGSDSSAPNLGQVNTLINDAISGISGSLKNAKYATSYSLPSYSYSNGTSGVGATITANSAGALEIDGVNPENDDIVLIKDETGGAAIYNGLYKVTVKGDGSTPFVITRQTSLDQSAEFEGALIDVSRGSTNKNTIWAYSGVPTPALDDDNITFKNIGRVSSVSVGTLLSVDNSDPSNPVVGLDIANIIGDTDPTSTDHAYSASKTEDLVSTKISTLLNLRTDAFDASDGTYPTSGGSGDGGAINQWDAFVIGTAGVIGDKDLKKGDILYALDDTPGQTDSNWGDINHVIGYVPENVANKQTGDTLSDSTTAYPSSHTVKHAIDAQTSTADEVTITKDGTEFSVKDGGIGTSKIAAKSVTQAKIGDKAVGTGQIDDAAVTAAQLAANVSTPVEVITFTADQFSSDKLVISSDGGHSLGANSQIKAVSIKDSEGNEVSGVPQQTITADGGGSLKGDVVIYCAQALAFDGTAVLQRFAIG